MDLDHSPATGPTSDPAGDPTPLPPPAPAGRTGRAGGRRRWRGIVAGVVAGGVLGAAVASPVVWALARDERVTTSATSVTSPDVSTNPFGGSGTTTPSTPTSPFDGSTSGGTSGGTTSPYDGSGGATTPFGGTGGTGDTGGGTGGSTSSDAATATDATEAQSAGVALVDTTLDGGTGAGTGLVLSADGLVLTNYHVVEDSTSVQVTIATTGATYTGTVVGHDETADVALVQLADASGLTTVDLDDDGGATVSEAVTAIGNAEGQGYLSASAGTVQALDQSITTSESDGSVDESLTGLIEMNAVVVGGYSGGALLDAEGEVVGITTAASSGGVAESYAVPIATALAVVAQIESGDESGAVEIGPSAYLGIAVASSSGLQVGEVESGGAAEAAGLVAGDTVTSLGGTPVSTLQELSAALAEHEPGDRVRLGWTDASGAAQTATLTLGSSPVN